MSFAAKFDRFVCIGDSITCEVDGYEVSARIVYDDVSGPPDKIQEASRGQATTGKYDDGFWPSLHPDSSGFIGAGNGWRARFDAAQARAERILSAWKNDERFYCGIVLSVVFDGIELSDHAASLWGIEANYPDSDNAYLNEAAQDLLHEALQEGQKIHARLCCVQSPKDAA